MASLKDLRRRISSVKNTQQITSAMRLVAASKLRRAQQAILGTKPYAQRIEELTRRMISEMTKNLETSSEEDREKALKKLHPLLNETPQERAPKQALIIISSDRGLCGAYNAAVSRFALKHYRKLQSEGKDVDLYFYGRKAFDIFKRFQIRGKLIEDFWLRPLTTARAAAVADEFVKKYLAYEYHKVEVVFTEFKSALSQTPMVKTMLPLSVQTCGLSNETLPFIYEPGREALLSSLIPKQVRTQFYRVFADSFASEMGSRMTAMENATRNAGQMIGRLTLLANRTRQAAITTELTEIVGGAEALKG